MDRTNLVVETGALTTRLIIENGRAAGVEYFANRSALARATANAELILAAGAIGSREQMIAHIRANASTSWRPIATCRMGIDDHAVVGLDLRVRGVERLRVCDASIMPSMISGDTNAPTILIAEKGADLILGSQAPASFP